MIASWTYTHLENQSLVTQNSFMTLTLGMITPHTPLLRETIGKENRARFNKTIAAFSYLQTKLTEINIDTIVVLAPHGRSESNSFVLNIHRGYESDYSEFGDFSNGTTYKSDLDLMNRIRKLDTTGLPLGVTSEERIPYSISLPLEEILERNTPVKIVPIHYGKLEREIYFQFGQQLQEILQNTNKKVAVIASSDLSHRLTKESPGGFSPQGAKFDRKIKQLLDKQAISDILTLDQNFVDEAGECGLGAILVLLGIFDQINYSLKVLSYENPFGVGCLSAILR